MSLRARAMRLGGLSAIGWLIWTLVAVSLNLLIFAGTSGAATCACANQLCQLNEEQSALYLTCTKWRKAPKSQLI